MRGFIKNRRAFSDVCYNTFGRQMIMTNAKSIDASNIVVELGKAYAIHLKNREEIDYLERYYKGDQPIRYREKKVRPEINNRVVENRALETVEHKVAENFGEPVQYVLKSAVESDKDNKSIQLNELNDFNEIENKAEVDVQMARDRSICGTSYRYTYDRVDYTEDEAPFGFEREDPKDTFVVYTSGVGKNALMSVQVRKDEEDKTYFFCYTKTEWFKIRNSKMEDRGINGRKNIPVVEYPNNFYRLSDIEIVIDIYDQINKIQSDRMNGIEQFIQAFIKFVNCEIDEDTYSKMKEQGCLAVKSTNQGLNAEVAIMESELNQEQTQVAKDDLYDSALEISGMPDRQENSGGDSGQAVVLRNGYYFSEKRSEISEHVYKKAERESLKVVLSILRIKGLTDLTLKDIEIKLTRSKMDNMLVKAEVLKMLVEAGIDPKVVIKVCNLFSDPEEVYLESKPYLDAKYSPQVIGEEDASQTTNTDNLQQV